MILSDISIRRPVFAWMLMAGLIVFGAISFFRMGLSQLPDVDFPVVNVSLTLQGAAPEVMETDIVDVVEDAVMSIEGVRSVTSSSRNGSATVTIEFELNRNIDAAIQDVQTKIGQAQRMLPREMDPPVVTKTNPEDQPVIWLALSSETMPLKDIMAYVRDVVKDQFSTVEGVGDITLGGYLDPNLRIWVDANQLRRYALTVTDVVNTVKNEHAEPPAGFLDTGRREFNVRTLGEAANVKAFENLVINSRGGQPNFNPIPLSRVAKVEEGLADIRRLSRANGKPAVGLGIRKQRGSNAVAVARAVKKRMVEVQKTLPQGMRLDVNFDSSRFIEESVGELNFTLFLSAALTAVVCWLFLGSFSSTLNVLLAIPTSIVGAFTILYFMGFTLNTFTLLGLSLAIGIVVDDAIMVLENIIRHREHGESKVRAAHGGAREITFAATAATLAIVAIFLPVAFMKGIIGKFFFQFGVTMTVAVLLSLLEALTLTPMRCAQFLDTGERTTRFGKFIERLIDGTRRGYAWSLARALNHRWLVIAGSLVIFATSLLTARKINQEFVPPQDQSLFLVRIQTPVGSALAYTDSKFKLAEQFLASRPEVDRYYVAIGGFGGGDVRTGISFVTMKPKGKRGIDPEAGHELTQQEFMNLCRKQFNKIPDVKAVVQDLSQSGFSASRGFPVEFTIQGPDWDVLAQSSTRIMDELTRTGLVTDVDSDYQVGMPELHIIPNRTAASMRGVSIATIGETVNAMIGGELVGRYPKGGHRYDIRVKLADTGEDRRQIIEELYVRNNRGEILPLKDVVTVEEKPTLQAIARRNRERAVTIFANVVGGKSQAEALKVAEQIAARTLKPGYHLAFSGSAQTFRESFQSLVFALVLGIFVAYMVLASQFNSFIDPFTVLVALPFSLTGALIGLVLAHQTLNIYSMIGLILLMGIVKKNSILLVDFTNQVRDTEGKEGKEGVREALLKACPVRLRPILMTSIAIIVGAIPPALAIGPGAETRIPMAVSVIGGTLVSTLLTLYVVPCVYSLAARRRRTGEVERELAAAPASQPLDLAPEPA